MIEVGQPIPSVTLKQATPEGGADVNPAELFAGKKVLMFSLPGAFTPTCTQKHLPGFVTQYGALKAKGVDIIACLSVNDHHVMRAWAESQHALGKIVFLADGAGLFSKALGIDQDLTKANMGLRARRGVIQFDNGKVTCVDMEEPGKFEVSSAEACMKRLS